MYDLKFTFSVNLNWSCSQMSWYWDPIQQLPLSEREDGLQAGGFLLAGEVSLFFGRGCQICRLMARGAMMAMLWPE